MLRVVGDDSNLTLSARSVTAPVPFINLNDYSYSAFVLDAPFIAGRDTTKASRWGGKGVKSKDTFFKSSGSRAQWTS